jgi:hypothetical protein
MCDTIPSSYGTCVMCEGDWHVVQKHPDSMSESSFWFWHVHGDIVSADMPWLVDLFRWKDPPGEDHDHQETDWHCCSCRKPPPEKLVAIYSLLNYEEVSSRMAECLGPLK